MTVPYLAYPTRKNYIKHRHYVTRKDGHRAWLIAAADRWLVYIDGHLICQRLTWESALSAARDGRRK